MRDLSNGAGASEGEKKMEEKKERKEKKLERERKIVYTRVYEREYPSILLISLTFVRYYLISSIMFEEGEK